MKSLPTEPQMLDLNSSGPDNEYVSIMSVMGTGGGDGDYSARCHHQSSFISSWIFNSPLMLLTAEW